MTTAFFVIAVLLKATPEGERGAKASPPGSYCGVQALALAMRSYGKEIEFVDLLKPAYISSRPGSSGDDLVRAAQDFGFHASIKTNLSCFILKNASCPVILHVKNSRESETYNHWVLFSGWKDSQAVIYDGVKPVALVDSRELASIWDGVGVLVEQAEGNSWWMGLAFFAQAIFLGGITVFSLAFGLFLYDRILKSLMSRFAQVAQGFALVESAVVVMVAILLWGGFRYMNPGGFLSSEQTLQGIQGRFRASFLPKVGPKEVEELMTDSALLIVDARTPTDYERGHLERSINIPYYYSAKQVLGALEKTPKTTRIVVYCQNYGCYFSHVTARKLLELGFENPVLFRDGWQGWQKYKTE